jgi:hypothetical protein
VISGDAQSAELGVAYRPTPLVRNEEVKTGVKAIVGKQGGAFTETINHPPMESDPEHPFVQKMAERADAAGFSDLTNFDGLSWLTRRFMSVNDTKEKMPYGSDASVLQKHFPKSVFVTASSAGPENGVHDSSGEYYSWDQALKDTRFYQRTLVEETGVTPPPARPPSKDKATRGI